MNDLWQSVSQWVHNNQNQLWNALFYFIITILLAFIGYAFLSKLIKKAKKNEVIDVKEPSISKAVTYVSELGDEILIADHVAWYVGVDGTAERLISVEGKKAPSKGKAIYFAREVKVTEVALNDEMGERSQSVEKEYVVLIFNGKTVKLGETEFKRA